MTKQKKLTFFMILSICILIAIAGLCILLFTSNLKNKAEDSLASTITATLNANGGNVNGTTLTGAMNDTVSLPTPTREGYVFKGWYQANYIEKAALSDKGKLFNDGRNRDPFFRNSTCDLVVYNNNNNGAVTLDYIQKTSDNWNSGSNQMLKITSTGGASPGLGGYYYSIDCYANMETYVIIQAKIPVGYSIEWESNNYGSGGLQKWLTPVEGTGNWETYVHYLHCGTGTLSTTHFFAIMGPEPSKSNPLEWYVANTSVYDITGKGYNPDTFVENMGKPAKYTFGNGNQTLIAMWEKLITLTLDANGGSVENTTVKQKKGTTYDLPIPYREGYTFKGWAQASYVNGAVIGNKGTLAAGSRNQDPFFIMGTNGIWPYNPVGNGNAKITRLSENVFVNPCSIVMQIDTTTTDKSYYGGYSHQISTYANAEFYTIIQAKIPMGYEIQFASNHIGEEGSSRAWLTPTAGTGDWETYIHYVRCGRSGTFEDSEYYYISGDSDSSLTTRWYITNSSVYDATGLGLEPNTFVENMSKKVSYTFGTSDQILIAMWESDSWDKYSKEPLSWNGVYQVYTPEELAWFAYKSKQGVVKDSIALMNDINLEGKTWPGISSFMGVFNGGNHTIRHLAYFNTPAFFGTLSSAIIRDVTFEGNIFSKDFTRSGPYTSLADQCNDSYILRCINRLDFKNFNQASSLMEGPVGGLINEAQNSVIEYCSNFGSCKSSGDAGGIVGKAVDCNLNNCSNFGYIQANGFFVYAGGICGRLIINNLSEITFTGLMNFGNVSAVSPGEPLSSLASAGGLIGGLDTSTVCKMVTFYRSYSCGDIYAYGSVGGLIGSLLGAKVEEIKVNTCAFNENLESKSRGNNSIGGLIGYASSLATLEVLNTYVISNIDELISPDKMFYGSNSSSATLGLNIRNTYVLGMFSDETLKEYWGLFKKGWHYMRGVNRNLPVPEWLYQIAGSAIDQDIEAYLLSLGFTAG